MINWEQFSEYGACIDIETAFQSSQVSLNVPYTDPPSLYQSLLHIGIDEFNANSDNYTLYLSPAFAMAEVIYSQLCHLFLDISCVKSCYATSEREWIMPSDVPFISISDHSKLWTPYEMWRNKGTLTGAILSNHVDISYHRALTSISGRFWEDIGAGYIDSNLNFIKANNQFAFFSTGLFALLGYGSNTSLTATTVSASEFYEDTADFPEGRVKVIDRLAKLTDVDIARLCLLPPKIANFWHDTEKSQKYFEERLRKMRETAIRIAY